MRFPCALFLFPLFTSCQGCESDEIIPVMSAIDAWEPTVVQVVPVVGGAELAVPVRLLNRYGVAVPDGDVTLSVSGATAAPRQATLALDTLGQGWLTVTTEEPEEFTVSVETAPGLAAGSEATCWSTQGGLPPASWAPLAWPLDELTSPRWIHAVPEGMLLVGETRIWHLSTEPGSMPFPVVSTDDPIRKVIPRHLDGDGITDLLVQTDEEVLLLRGLEGGGYAWGAGFAAPGRTIIGTAIADIDGDNRLDVGVAHKDMSGTVIALLEHDGAWGFVEGEKILLEMVIGDFTLADSDADGRAEVVALTHGGMVKRYSRSSGAWLETGPTELDSQLSEGASLLPAADLDGGGAEDIIVKGPEQEGSTTQISFFTMEGGAVRYRTGFTDPALAVADISGDGLADLVALTEEALQVMSWEGASGFIQRTVSGLRAADDIAVGDMDGDGWPDLAGLEQGVTVYAGRHRETPWAPAGPGWRLYGQDLPLPPVVLPPLGDEDAPVIAAFVNRDGEVEVRLWYVPDEEDFTIRVLADVTMPSGALPLALEPCGDRILALVDDDGPLLVSILIQEEGAPVVAAEQAVEGSLMACGDFGAATVAVVDLAGEGVLLDESLETVEVLSLGPVEAITAARLRLDGPAEVVGCEIEGCSVLAADVDADGLDEIFIVEGDILEARLDGTTAQSEQGGAISAGDLTGDGRTEILTVQGSTAWVHRPLVNGMAPPAGYRGRDDLLGPWQMIDLDGDGVIDFVTRLETGELSILIRGGGEVEEN